MRLKISQITLADCVKITHNYLIMKSIYADADSFVCSDVFSKIHTNSINNILSIPLIVFVKDDTEFTTKASSSIRKFPYLLDTISMNITNILNPEIVFYFRNILKNNKDKSIADKQIDIVFIKDESNVDMDFIKINKINLLTQLLIFTNENTSSLNIDLLLKIYGENELDFFGSTSIKKLFTKNRKASIVKSNSDIENPWLNLYLQPNKTYLSFDNASNPKKDIKLIHCPICAREHKLKDGLIRLEDNKIFFKCNHDNTQFAKYDPFQIPCAFFSPDVVRENDIKKLQYFFKNNVQPINIDSIYMIKILTPGDKSTFLPLKKFMKFKSTTIDLRRKSILKKFLCPICGKSHLIYFTDESWEDYKDINNVEYIHYSKMFVNGDRIVFNCDHSGTLYDMYKSFSIKSINSRTFMEQAVLMTERYSANFMDGKKVIVQVIDNDSYIIDMANYL